MSPTKENEIDLFLLFNFLVSPIIDLFDIVCLYFIAQIGDLFLLAKLKLYWAFFASYFKVYWASVAWLIDSILGLFIEPKTKIQIIPTVNSKIQITPTINSKQQTHLSFKL